MDEGWKLYFQSLVVFKSIKVRTRFLVAAFKNSQQSHSFTCDISTHIAAILLLFFCPIIKSLRVVAVVHPILYPFLLFLVVSIPVAVTIAVTVAISVLVSVASLACIGSVEYHCEVLKAFFLVNILELE